MSKPVRRLDLHVLARDIEACRSGEGEACDRLCAALRGPVNLSVARLLGDDHPDREDIVQEALLAVLGYLRRDTEFAGDLVRLAVTIARNRCRDILRRRRARPHLDIAALADWLADPGLSPLDALADADRRRHVQCALDRLDQPCRDLLEALYVQGVSTDVVRQQLGLGTVQAVYYRRAICLRQVRILFQKSLAAVQGSAAQSVSPQPRRDRAKA